MFLGGFAFSLFSVCFSSLSCDVSTKNPAHVPMWLVTAIRMVVCQRSKTNHFFSPIFKLFLCYLYLLSASPHFIPLIWDSGFGFIGASWLLCDPLWLAPRRSTRGRDVLAIYASWNFHVPDRATNVGQIVSERPDKNPTVSFIHSSF